MQYRILPETAEVTEVFEELHGERFSAALRALKTPGSYISDFCRWLSNHVCRKFESRLAHALTSFSGTNNTSSKNGTQGL